MLFRSPEPRRGRCARQGFGSLGVDPLVEGGRAGAHRVEDLVDPVLEGLEVERVGVVEDLRRVGRVPERHALEQALARSDARRGGGAQDDGAGAVGVGYSARARVFPLGGRTPLA